MCSYDPKTKSARSNKLQKPNRSAVYVENLDTSETWCFDYIKDFLNESSLILDGDSVNKKKWDALFQSTKDDYIIYNSGIYEYLIWKSKNKKE